VYYGSPTSFYSISEILITRAINTHNEIMIQIKPLNARWFSRIDALFAARDAAHLPLYFIKATEFKGIASKQLADCQN
jgi:hypothetical protein